jgi:SAM-dependent methyltransferase
MMHLSQKELRDLYLAIDREFPFPGYITSGHDYSYLAKCVCDYLPRGSRVLDFGAGPGNFTALLARLGYDCYAWDDLSDPWHLLEDNKDRILTFCAREGIKYTVLTTPHLPTGIEFDGIILSDVIERLHDPPQKLLIELVKRLKTGGYLFITTPNAVNLRKRIDVLRGKTNYPSLNSFFFSPPPWRGHIREYTLDELIKILSFLALDVVRAEWFLSVLDVKVKSGIAKFLFKAFTRLFPSCRDSLLVIGCKPAGWSVEIHYELPAVYAHR